MTRRRIRVVKVGGSLLACQQLPQWLAVWLTHDQGCTHTDAARHDAARHDAARIDVLIAGGGTLVDHVRQLDQRFSLSSETTHEMSINAMCRTSRLLAGLLNVGQPVQRWDDLQVIISGDESQSIVFDVQQWLAELEPKHAGVRLTHDWRTTSDSIAARLARVLCADELALLKSTDISPGIDWTGAAAQALVDDHFPRVAADLPSVVWVNLRRFSGQTTSRSV